MEHSLNDQLTVAEVLQRWPQTVGVFLRHRMACVGCVIAPFETLSEVTAIYELNPDQFLQELRRTAGASQMEPPFSDPNATC